MDNASAPNPAPDRAAKPAYLRDFRRSLRFVWPHRRFLFASFAAALGVMVFYAAGMGALFPILEAMTSDFETLPDGVYRELADGRLGIDSPADVPRDNNDGIGVSRTTGDQSDEGVLAHHVSRGDTIMAVLGAEVPRGNCYVLFRQVVRHEGETVTLSIRRAGGSEADDRTVTVRLEPLPAYAPMLLAVADAIDYGPSPAGRVKALGLVIAVFVVLSGLQLFCRFWQQYLVELSTARALMDLRVEGYGHVLQLPMGFFSQHKTGELMTRFATDTNVLHLGMRTLFGKTVREPLKAVGVLVGVLVFVGWKLLVIVLVAGLPAALLIRRFGRIIRRSQRRALAAWDGLLDLLQERISGIRVVKSYTMERAERLRFFREHRRLFKNQLRVQRFDVATSPILEFLATAVVGAFVVYGGSLVFAGTYRASMFLQSVVFLVALFDPIRKLSNVNNRLQQAEAAAGRIYEMLDEPAEAATPGAAPAPRLPRHRERIEFRNVSFRYPSRPDVLVLCDIDLTVEAGETVAIVGPNGSGKTTLCNLLLRFHDPDEGSVCIDGHDVRTVNLDSLRRQIGLVTQDTVIFPDTVAANIGYGQRHLERDRIVSAARTAHADEFIARLQSPPDASRNGQPPATGYDALISSKTLSGGQKQRIAIARALLRDPAVLIFDEATSQIDPESARKIHDALRELRRNRTAFVIAHHDREMLPEADRVIVMDKGRIVASGKHDTLLASCSLYRDLYETQFTRSDAGDGVSDGGSG